ncbi:uncharacterized protein B0H18DRAFT_874379 [Fomitopsis serialis]|uniref:uncharacterized protein n=1 Tax=Fomitopsis serialis TaxID=139415 RepID=UPI002007AC01|nr:uncharacterized protein B0H18DRAFT_874379 [Neoantrodia serialis]KAH9928835.1 hypothetical protein B0H18DRAFT_874379 [Neoantrodia serialis]
MFSTLTLTGDAIPKPITLSRQEDFPACQFDADAGKFRTRPDWQPSSSPHNHAGHLFLRLGNCIGGGRSAVVYDAEILTTSASKEGYIPLPSEEKLCVKIARPNRCRTLAREAWVCDQLRSRDRLQGVIAPRTYGFFAVELSRQQPPTFPPWNTEDFELDLREDDPEDDPLRDDPLPGDRLIDVYDEGPGGRELSSWCHWRPDPDAPLLAVIVMSRGGAVYTREDDADKATQEDVRAILDDLAASYLWHGDLRPNNLVRAPAGTELCKTHNRVHAWNIIDFAWTCVDDANGDFKTKSRSIRELQRAGFGTWYFWHGSHT